ncbi:MAG: inositol monophosphatase [Ignavibacteria bacterium]|nr:inositol monophosphatase [Ignavibacteria bacterium]
MEREKLKDVLLKAAVEAAEVLREYYGRDFKIGRKKSYNDLVTEADYQSEKKITEIISNNFPSHNILGEEGGNRNLESDFLWIIDPLDGTVNFAHGIQLFCVSIALEFRREIIMGVVYSPLTNELFFAEKGKGAFLNDVPIKVSKTESLKDALLVTGFPYGAKDNIGNCIDHFVNFVKLGLPIRRLGSAAMDICYLACGRFDGFWEVNLNPWDVAASVLIASEAGGKVTDFTGREFSIYDKEILVTNGRRIHDEMIEVLSMR